MYVAGGIGNAVAVFSRNAATGKLTFVEAEVDGVAGVDGLASSWSVAVTPDGTNVYATGMLDNAVAVFGRDAASGRLSFVEAQFGASGGVAGLGGAWLVAVSPDGAHVYVAGASDDAIAVFQRGPGGALTFVEAETNGVGGVEGLDDARGVTPSPDGAHLYATGVNDHAVTAFAVTACGNGRVEPSECCDLGAHNGMAGSGCAVDCSCRGRCTNTGAECARAADCTGGAGCCGNRVLEDGEQCDDGNLDDNDCCTARCETRCTTCVPQCGDAFGPPPASAADADALQGPDGRWLLRTMEAPVPGQAEARSRSVVRPRHRGCSSRPRRGRARPRVPAAAPRPRRVPSRGGPM